jgi:hypothetical protein
VKKIAGTILLVLLAAACGSRRTMSPAQGRAYRAALYAQTANKDPQAALQKKPLAGLDPDEAQIVYDNYKRSLTPKEAQQQKKPSSVIVVEEDDDKKKSSRD